MGKTYRRFKKKEMGKFGKRYKSKRSRAEDDPRLKQQNCQDVPDGVPEFGENDEISNLLENNLK